ncbi:hypothetical protein BGW80DRAFT_1379265 [Lactifluus volemus]|nr:hypothetical protein BGW80DRAFT_1379265 [Lactifluus volemus]
MQRGIILALTLLPYICPDRRPLRSLPFFDSSSYAFRSFSITSAGRQWFYRKRGRNLGGSTTSQATRTTTGEQGQEKRS